MRRVFLVIVSVVMAMVGTLQASPVSVSAARQVADNFFSSATGRLSSRGTQAMTRLAYSAPQDRFYIFDRGGQGGFVVVAGDDRLPQVLGYGDKGDFAATLPPSVQYWVDELDRQIAYLQSHDNVTAYRPAMRGTVIEPLLTSRWNQDSPYNDLCPTYTGSNGQTSRCAAGCVATAMAQVMNYHQWPATGRGSHSYTCHVNGGEAVELSADFSHSVYRWDLMLDDYDQESSPESCEAVARLLLDVGISVDMSYGSSSAATEEDALHALQRYFDYYDRSYILSRDFFSAEEWDQFLVNELSASRPILYCGMATSAGHAFVLDGIDADGYFHFNWGWGGSFDGYFLVSALNPGGTDFKYMQDGMFGLVPSPQASEIEDVMYIRSLMYPDTPSAQLGQNVTVSIDDFVFQGNKATGYTTYGDEIRYYAEVPMSLAVIDSHGIERQNYRYTVRVSLGNAWNSTGKSINLLLPQTLEDGEYKIKLYYSADGGQSYDQEVFNYGRRELYIKMIVRDGTAYLYDCFLSDRYSVDAMAMPSSITINQLVNVDVTMSYQTWWSSSGGPMGKVYLSLFKDDATEEEVATSEMYEVQLPANSPVTYQMQITAPDEWGPYILTLKDEAGNRLVKTPDGWDWEYTDVAYDIFVLPVCKALIEDFETMAANSSTSAKDVQGNFTTWSFNKSGVRAPGEEKCNGTHSVLMKNPSTVTTSQPLCHNFFLAQATFFNPSTNPTKFRMDYSQDGGTTWQTAIALDSVDVVEVPKKSKALITWYLNMDSSLPAIFRIAMVGGTGTAYVDDISLYYTELAGDVNGDGEVNIADVNAVIRMILSGSGDQAGDVNGDGEVNIGDVNTIIRLILND